MISLQPREYFTIVRQLPDPGDVSTYYIKAVITNSRTGDVIDSINLINRGSQRFTYAYQVPADVSNLGFYIDITTHVYTDSSYSVYSTVYGKDNNSYLVFDRITRLSGGGGGGGEVDYKKIAKTLMGVIAPLVNIDSKGNIISLKLQDQVDLTPVLNYLQAIHKTCQEIEIPEPIEKVDLSPVLQAVKVSADHIVKTINDKEVTEKTELEPVLNAISKLDTKVEENKIDPHILLKSTEEKVIELVTEISTSEKNVTNMVEKLKDAFVYSLAQIVKTDDKEVRLKRITEITKTL